jgi:hypothetical protein
MASYFGKLRIFLISLLFIILLVLVGGGFSAQARICEDHDGELVMSGSNCPCPPDNDQGLAVVCGTVRDARITEDSDGIKTTGNPMSGVTVAIYESDPTSPTGKIAGRLTNLYSSTSTNEDGRYSLYMRRIGPGSNMVYIAYLCYGRLAGLKKASSMMDIVDLHEYINCWGTPYPSPPPDQLNIVNKDSFLGCETQEADPNIGYSEPVVEHYSADGGEVGYDGRFKVAAGWFRLLFPNAFPSNYSGAYWSKDCIHKYNNSSLCDTDEAPMNPEHKLVYPYFAHIPKHNIILAYRTWESRSGVRQMAQYPKAGAQYMSSLFGNCVGDAYLREFGTTATDQLISCEAFRDCSNIISDSTRNTRTAASAASLLSTPGTWEEVYSAEGQPDMEVCRGSEGPVTLGQIKPPWILCEIGTEGCDYVLDSEYWLPELMYRKDGARYGWTDQNINDSFSSVGIRETQFDPVETEARKPHELGGDNIFPKGGEANPNNSPLTGVRISSENTELGEVGGVLTDWVRSPFSEETFEDSVTVWNMGGDIRNLCNLSSSQGIRTVTTATESGLYPGNWFRGNPNHYPDTSDPKDGLSRTVGTSSYSTSIAIQRDAALQDYAFLDLHDSILRYLSGTGELTFTRAVWLSILSVVNRIGSSGPLKTFAERGVTDTGAENALSDPISRDDMTVSFSLAETNFETEFRLPGPNYTVDEWRTSDHECYRWRSLNVNDSCNTYPEVNEYGDPVSRTCRLDSCGASRYVRTCTCHWGQIVPDSCVDTLEESDCTLEQRRECAINQIATSPGSPPLPGDPTCPLFDEVPYDSHSYGGWVHGCAMSTAGPYQCDADLQKDFSFRSIQQPTRELESQVPVDPLYLASNQQYQSFRSPFEGISYRVGASLDYRTSNDVSVGEVGLHLDGMPTEGVGTGASSATLTLTADPLIFFSTNPYNPVNIHCNDGRGGSGVWNCPPIPLPAPVEEEDLLARARARPECSVSATCNAPSLVQTIANAAAADIGIPAALIIAEIYNENRPSEYPFPHWRLEYYDDIYNASFPWYGRIHNCNDQVWSAQGPYGWLTSWFENVRHSTELISEGRSATASKCNFLDATYAMAHALKNNGLRLIECDSDWEAVRHALYVVTWGFPRDDREWGETPRPENRDDGWIEGFVRDRFYECNQ